MSAFGSGDIFMNGSSGRYSFRMVENSVEETVGSIEGRLLMAISFNWGARFSTGFEAEVYAE